MAMSPTQLGQGRMDVQVDVARRPTSTHSMLSTLFMQSGPQPSPPRHVGLHWHIMMSSSSCTLRRLWLTALADTRCHTTG